MTEQMILTTGSSTLVPTVLERVTMAPGDGARYQIVSGLVEPSGGRLFIDGLEHTGTPVHRRDTLTVSIEHRFQKLATRYKIGAGNGIQR